MSDAVKELGSCHRAQAIWRFEKGHVQRFGLPHDLQFERHGQGDSLLSNLCEAIRCQPREHEQQAMAAELPRSNNVTGGYQELVGADADEDGCTLRHGTPLLINGDDASIGALQPADRCLEEIDVLARHHITLVHSTFLGRPKILPAKCIPHRSDDHRQDRHRPKKYTSGPTTREEIAGGHCKGRAAPMLPPDDRWWVTKGFGKLSPIKCNSSQ